MFPLEKADSSPANNVGSVNPALTATTVVDNTQQTENRVVACTSHIGYQTSTVLLSTADAQLIDARGNFQRVRMLLDSGSTARFISRGCIKRLGLKFDKLSIPIEESVALYHKRKASLIVLYVPFIS